MLPRMYSSVKFFDPTVSETLPLAGFDWIRLSEEGAPEPDDVELVVSLLEPQAATTMAITRARIAPKKKRERADVIENPSLGLGRLRLGRLRESYARRAARRSLSPFGVSGLWERTSSWESGGPSTETEIPPATPP